MCNLPNSTYGMYERMHAKQERVDSLNYFNDTVFLTLINRSGAYCLSSLLVTANQISRLGEAPHGSCVYRRKSI